MQPNKLDGHVSLAITPKGGVRVVQWWAGGYAYDQLADAIKQAKKEVGLPCN